MGFVSKRINEFAIGQWALVKVQWTINITILLKIFKVDFWVYITVIPILLMSIWAVGVYIHRSGLWDNYMAESMKGIKKIK